MRVLIIANPIAGGGRGRIRAEALHRCLSAKVGSAELFLTRAAGDARAAGAAATGDGIVVVGGDGTVNEALNGLGDRAMWLGVLPVGTANVVARELRMPHLPEAMADVVAGGRTRRVDVGRCGERRFLLGAGAGLDAAVVAAVHARRGKRLGLRRWVRPTLATLCRYGYPRIRAVVDGVTLCEDARYVIVGNCRYSAGVFPSTPLARIDDGLLDVCALRDTGMLRLARLAVATFRPGFSGRADVRYAQGREVRLEPADDAAAPLQIDGDPAGCIPAAFTIAPTALEVLAPPGS